jgi:hypothetical protein
MAAATRAQSQRPNCLRSVFTAAVTVAMSCARSSSAVSIARAGVCDFFWRLTGRPLLSMIQTTLYHGSARPRLAQLRILRAGAPHRG